MATQDGRATTERWEAGARIAAKYDLVRRLDQGGMGTVWVAHNTDLDMHVALKLIRAGADSPDNAERLLKEARILARLEHPGIVRVFDAGLLPTGEPYIVMELLNGDCLGDLIERFGRMEAARAIQLLLPIADALAAAHELGIVHRDVKPENVFLAKLPLGRLQPKLLDFGIARLEHFQGARITQDGALIGSPAYMSPEQARGETDVDARADVWGFSVVAYETVTGRRPFGGGNYNATLRAIIEREPTPTHEQAAGDAALWAILARGLSKDPALRWPTMRELGAALAAWLVERGVSEDATRVSLRSHWLIEAPSTESHSVPPIAIPPSGPPSASERRLSAMTPTVAGPPPMLSTGGHGAVSLTRNMSRPRAGALIVLGAGIVAAALAVGWHALKGRAAPTSTAAQSASAVMPPTPALERPPPPVSQRPAPPVSEGPAPPAESAKPSVPPIPASSSSRTPRPSESAPARVERTRRQRASERDPNQPFRPHRP